MNTLSKLIVCRFLASVVGIVLLTGLMAVAGEPQLLRRVTIDWGDKKFTDLSGVGVVGRFLLVCNDESKHSIHVLESQNDGYKYYGHIRLTVQEDELDLEGIACDKNTVYVVGSHSHNSRNERVKSRENVFRFELTSNGHHKTPVESISLSDVIAKHPALELASHKAPKEGGVDIEGIAVCDDWLYAGFRSPLLRGDALVLKFRFKNPGESQLLSVELGGLGIRDITHVTSGFLILAGPKDASTGPYQLHHWDGQGGPDHKARQLCAVPAKDGAKAEGLAVINEDQATYECLVLYDGLMGGNPTLFRVKK